MALKPGDSPEIYEGRQAYYALWAELENTCMGEAL